MSSNTSIFIYTGNQTKGSLWQNGALPLSLTSTFVSLPASEIASEHLTCETNATKEIQGKVITKDGMNIVIQLEYIKLRPGNRWHTN